MVTNISYICFTGKHETFTGAILKGNIRITAWQLLYICLFETKLCKYIYNIRPLHVPSNYYAVCNIRVLLCYVLLKVTSRHSTKVGCTDSMTGRGKRFLSTPQRPDRLWGPFSRLSNGYMRRFPFEYSDRGVKVTICLHLLPRSRMVALYLHSPIRLIDMVIN
jgi:hypothetical protein